MQIKTYIYVFNERNRKLALLILHLTIKAPERTRAVGFSNKKYKIQIPHNLYSQNKLI